MSTGRTLLGALAAAAAIVVVVRSCKSDEQRLSEMVDAAREALDERRPDDFLARFADPLAYRAGRGRAELRQDLDRFLEIGIGRVEILERKIVVGADGDIDGAETATIDLRCRIAAGMESLAEVAVALRAAKRDGDWIVTRFTWK
jgi:hypothetical protein